MTEQQHATRHAGARNAAARNAGARNAERKTEGGHPRRLAPTTPPKTPHAHLNKRKHCNRFWGANPTRVRDTPLDVPCDTANYRAAPTAKVLATNTLFKRSIPIGGKALG